VGRPITPNVEASWTQSLPTGIFQAMCVPLSSRWRACASWFRTSQAGVTRPCFTKSESIAPMVILAAHYAIRQSVRRGLESPNTQGKGEGALFCLVRCAGFWRLAWSGNTTLSWSLMSERCPSRPCLNHSNGRSQSPSGASRRDLLKRLGSGSALKPLPVTALCFKRSGKQCRAASITMSILAAIITTVP